MGTRALITGIAGQDGSYLAELLLEKGYSVHGIIRSVALEDPIHRLARIAHIMDRIHLHPATLENYLSISTVMQNVRPNEVYHLAAQSFVHQSFDDSFSTLIGNISGTHHMLAALRHSVPNARFYFAASSEMFGNATEVPQRETSPFRPRSPYGISKVAGYELTRNYREAYGMFCSSGILFNHEGPRRGFEFITRKITAAVARIRLGLQKELLLGNLDAQRDWGHAKDYVRAMWAMLQQDQPDDFVVATGRIHHVRDFAEKAFASVGLDYRHYVKINPQFFRPAEANPLVGDPSKARKVLGWEPTYSFDDLVQEMVASDLALLSKQEPAAFAAAPDSPIMPLVRKLLQSHSS